MKQARPSYIAVTLIFMSLTCLAKADDWERFKLHYTKPANDWSKEALPVGNGRLGAMCFGGIETARIQLNEESIWAGPPVPQPNPKFKEAMAKARTLWFDGDYTQAEKTLQDVMAPRISPRSHQTLGDLRLQFPGLEGKQTANYRRELDLDRAVATTTFEAEGVTYTREVFATAVDDVLVIRQRASKSGKLTMQIDLTRPSDFKTRAANDHTLVMSGQAQHKGEHLGVKWTAVLKAEIDGGEIKAEGNVLSITGADTVTFYLSCHSDYNRHNTGKPLQDDLLAQCDDTLEEVMAKSYTNVLSAHTADHRRYFRRCSIDLGGHEAAAKPTDERMADYRRAEAAKSFSSDVDLLTLYFQYGRYMLIGSSRPGNLPANLQGIWNDKTEAPWNADYHININIQMNYWPAEITNLSEVHEPFFSFIERLVPNGRKTARELFGCDGFTAPHTTDVWHYTSPFGKLRYGMWPHGAAWATSHFMEHYRYTGDKEFLRVRAWPIIAEAAKFYLDYLVKDPVTGKLVSGLDNSPENEYRGSDQKVHSVSMGPSMSQQIIWEVFNNTLEIADILNIDDDLIKRVREAEAHLFEPQVGKDGRLMEWAKPFEEPSKGHRHVSHLYAVHPGAQYTYERNPEMIKAARNSIDYRLAHGGAGTGWSRAWTINFFARFHDGDEAFKNLHALLGSQSRGAYSTNDNLFDMHPPFQIDGNFGGTAGMAEMLMQSHAGTIHLLPALPASWPEGKATGFRARGDLELDIEWANGKLDSVTLKAGDNYQNMPLRYGDKKIESELKPGETKRITIRDFK